jgi:hypothetical protein
VAVLSPYLFNVLIGLTVVGLFYLAVPIVAELGFKEGCRKAKDLILKAPASFVGLNFFFMMALIAIVSIAVNVVLAVIALLVVAFLYLPIYSLTAYYLAHSALRR